MSISLKFNKYFHAILAEVLRSGKKIYINTASFSASIDTSIANIEQLKMFFKMADVKYEKTTDPKKYKKVFWGDTDIELVRFFGIPISITKISNEDLSRHISWIEGVCIDNDIHLESSEWDRIIKMAERIGL